MRKLVAAFSLIALVAWVMPLGAFIKPSQEKSACGGKRGFHMCDMMKAAAAKRAADRSSGKVSFENASAAEKTNKSASGSGSDDVLLAALRVACSAKSIRFFSEEPVPLYPRFLLSPEPVPKARPV